MRRPLFFQKSLLRCLAGLIFFVLLAEDYGAPIDHAKITEVVNDVSVLDAEARHGAPARTDAMFQTPQIMKTGAASRSEMVADDKSVTRVGANSLFSFEPKERVINLKEGSVLFQTPSGKGGGEVRTVAATAAVLGTTIIVVVTKAGDFKLLVLEGNGLVTLPNGKRVIVHAGQLVVVPAGAKTPGPVRNFRVKDEVATSLLVMGFRRRLPSWNEILKEIQIQEAEIASGQLQTPSQALGNIVDPNTRINAAQSQQSNPGSPTGAGTPEPTPAGGTTHKLKGKNPAGPKSPV